VDLGLDVGRRASLGELRGVDAEGLHVAQVRVEGHRPRVWGRRGLGDGDRAHRAEPLDGALHLLLGRPKVEALDGLRREVPTRC
jgi:hypothetical protein